MTTILAIDCSTGPSSVALWREGVVAVYLENLSPIMQSVTLIPMVEEALRQSNIQYSDLTSVATTTGPGSFTGIRIGLATARGIAFAAGIAVMGYTTLEVLAYGAFLSPLPEGGRVREGALFSSSTQGPLPDPPPLSAGEGILAILNAGKGECYYQGFTARAALFAPRLAALETALADVPAPALIAGNALTPANYRACGVTFPRADLLAALAASGAPATDTTPFYIRPPDAKLPTRP